MDRRHFLIQSGGFAIFGRFMPRASLPTGKTPALDQADGFKREAAWYRKMDGKQVECQLCPRRCKVADQETGWCGVRSNDRGIYYTHVYGRAVTIHSDPVEKKPLFHFLPSTETLSLSTVGCNFECLFCQNWELSQFRPEQVQGPYGFVSPAKLVAGAKKIGAKSVAFTYGEPVVFYEYMRDIAVHAKLKDLPAVMITNGFIEPRPMDALLDVISAVKVDFKAYSPEFYTKWCRGRLQPVLDTMLRIRKKKVWLELVHLTIPGLNDRPAQTEEMCKWIVHNLGPDVPVHFTRFHPTYKLTNVAKTPPATLQRQWEIAKNSGIHYAYTGNLPGHDAENTLCHHCGKMLVQRVGFAVVEKALRSGKCKWCDRPIPGVWG